MLRSRMLIMTITIIGAIAVVLSSTFIMFYAQANGFRSQIGSLDAEKAQLESQVTNLQVQNAQLQDQIDHFEAEIAQLQDRIDSVEAENVQIWSQVDQLEKVRDYLWAMLLTGVTDEYSLSAYLTPE